MGNDTVGKTISCKYCLKYSKKRGCLANTCPYFKERMTAGSLNYKKAINEAFRCNPLFADKLPAIQKRLSNSVWNGDDHKRRMRILLRYSGKAGDDLANKYLAAAYLLTVTRILYENTQQCFSKQGLDFSLARKTGLSVDEYTLLGTAKTLFRGTADLTGEDIADPEIVSDRILPYIVTAVLIMRFGEAVLSGGV